MISSFGFRSLSFELHSLVGLHAYIILRYAKRLAAYVLSLYQVVLTEKAEERTNSCWPAISRSVFPSTTQHKDHASELPSVDRPRLLHPFAACFDPSISDAARLLSGARVGFRRRLNGIMATYTPRQIRRSLHGKRQTKRRTSPFRRPCMFEQGQRSILSIKTPLNKILKNMCDHIGINIYSTLFTT